VRGQKRRKKSAEDLAALPPEEQDEIRRKWWSFARGAGDLEEARLLLLLAALLHAKAPEATVRKRLADLHAWLVSGSNEGEGEGGRPARGLTADCLSVLELEALVSRLQGLHWHRSKASRILAASRALLEEPRFGGRVPTERAALRAVPGIGPKLAGVLAFVFAGEDAAWSCGLGKSSGGEAAHDGLEGDAEVPCGAEEATDDELFLQ